MSVSSKTNRGMLFGVVLSVCSIAACDKASDNEKQVNAAEAQANEKIALATKEADEKIADARAGFMKLREDYRHATTNNLVEVDRNVADLEAKAKLSVGQARIDLDARLAQIGAARDAFVKDYQTLDNVSGATWDDTKTRLDKELTNLKTLVDKG